MKHYFLLLVVLLLGFSACKKEYANEPITEWKQLGDFPGGARASATAFASDTAAYICLGRTGGYNMFLKDFWEYNPKTDVWTRKADFPGDARVKAVGGIIDGKAYVGLGAIGAYDLTNQFSDFYEFDTKTNIWTRKADFPGMGKNDLSSVVVNGCIYTTSGFTNTGFSNETYRYDPQTDKWTRMSNIPVSYGCTTGFSLGDFFYNGTGYSGGNHKDFYKYDVSKDKWSRVADLPEGRILSKSTSIHGKGYILLGRYWHGTENGGRLLDDVLEYDPLTNTWTKKGLFPGGARQNAVVFSLNGQGFVMTGETVSKRLNDVWMFEP